ncbi:hypothetical protein ABEB36_012568 [Hypothenemus hampei]|uniref:Carboxylic ester hydrolase n=1 Tax=Hypothenemus hampei TaxID=57062 RepID=A0ABD1EC12_HYPHA
MRIYFFLLLIVFVHKISYAEIIRYNQEKNVHTNYGNVIGHLRTSIDGKNRYWAFPGIPYAKPPVGDLRFKNPVPPDKWKYNLYLRKYTPRCIQRNYIFEQNPPIIGSEDCLYLNIYIPYSANPNSSIPVMVNIPWGGFFAGGGDDGYFDPTYFMTHNIIVVTINYRLGIFGFLSTLDDNAPGNYALKDQVLSLQWVKNNIANFGGDTNRITIVGQSAGAASSHLHMVSPSSKGLFSQAISQSGTGLAIWASTQNEVQKTLTTGVATVMLCPNLDTKLMVDCLRKVSAETLLKNEDALKIFYRFPLSSWSLVIENKTDENPEPFLTKSVEEYLKAGEFQKVPWLTGIVNGEGLLIASSILTRTEERRDLQNSFNTTMKALLLVTNETLWNKIYDFYFKNTGVNFDNLTFVKAFIDVFSDRYFFYNLYQSLKLQLEQGHNSIYLYLFEFLAEHSYSSWISTERNSSYSSFNHISNQYYASHCDDLLFQFLSPELFSYLKNPIDESVKKIWVDIWVNFAIYGKPNPKEHRILTPNWNPLSINDHNNLSKKLEYLKVSGNYLLECVFDKAKGFYDSRMEFWNEALK